jgi:hypothetical protein
MNGGCFCGFVRYEAGGAPTDRTTCHCVICRRTTGAPHVTWFTVRRDAFSVTTGTPASFRSSEHAVRTFCPRCGTQLTFASARFPDEIDVTVCSLDEPGAEPPTDHTFAASRVAWDVICDGLRSYPQARPR